MNLSFSTRGWSNYSWDELVALAAEMEFSGIEVCDVHDVEVLSQLVAGMARRVDKDFQLNRF